MLSESSASWSDDAGRVDASLHKVIKPVTLHNITDLMQFKWSRHPKDKSGVGPQLGEFKKFVNFKRCFFITLRAVKLTLWLKYLNLARLSRWR